MKQRTSTAERTLVAAFELLSDGIRPTVKRIREIIGPGGSDTTIHNALEQEFWPGLAQRLKRPNIPQSLAESFAAVWNEALNQAEVSFAEYRERADKHAEDAERRHSNALAQAEQLRLQISNLTENNQQLKSENARIQQQLLEKAGQYNGLQAKLGHAESNLRKAQAEHRALLAEEKRGALTAMRQLRAQIGEQKYMLDEAAQREQTWRADYLKLSDELRDVRKDLSNEIAILHEQRSQFAEQINRRESELNSTQQELHLAEKEFNRRLGDCNNRREALSNASAALTKQRDQARLRIAGLEQEVRTLRRQNHLLVDRIGPNGKTTPRA